MGAAWHALSTQTDNLTKAQARMKTTRATPSVSSDVVITTRAVHRCCMASDPYEDLLAIEEVEEQDLHQQEARGVQDIAYPLAVHV